MGASLTLAEARVDVVPGGAAVVVVTVHNVGSVVDEIAVEVLGDAAAWAVAEPASLPLFPGASGDVAISFLVPDGPDARPGSIPFAVRATCREDPAGTAVAEGELVVAGFAEATMLLSPQVTRGTRRAVAEVVLENKGNRSVAFDLEGTADGAGVSLDPSTVDVEAGELAVATVTVAPDRSFLRGPERVLVYGVTARGEGHPDLTVAGQMAQSARLPRWALGAAVVALAALVLVPLAMVGLRSQVRSAARDVAKEEVAKANPSSIDPSSEPTEGGPDGAATVAPPLADGARAIDGRLALTQAGQATFEVPANRTLRVTDIILQNPGANVGTLRVRRNDQVLLEVGLENFRTQDLHFITPLTFTGGQRLVLEASCSGACTPSALFSATILG